MIEENIVMSGFVKCLEKYVDDNKEPSTRSIFTRLQKAVNEITEMAKRLAERE